MMMDRRLDFEPVIRAATLFFDPQARYRILIASGVSFAGTPSLHQMRPHHHHQFAFLHSVSLMMMSLDHDESYLIR
jgi:hypothetical protein